MAITLSLWPKWVSASASDTITGRAFSITWRTMLSEMAPCALVIASLRTLREARMLRRRSSPLALGLTVGSSPSISSRKPLSAWVSSITSSSMASSSSSTLRRLISFSLKAKSLRTPASSAETPGLPEVEGASSSSSSFVSERASENIENASSTAPSWTRSPWTRRARRLRFLLMAISPSLSSSSREKSRPSKRICAWCSDMPAPGTATSLPRAFPIVVSGLWTQ